MGKGTSMMKQPGMKHHSLGGVRGYPCGREAAVVKGQVTYRKTDQIL